MHQLTFSLDRMVLYNAKIFPYYCAHTPSLQARCTKMHNLIKCVLCPANEGAWRLETPHSDVPAVEQTMGNV